jgi:hypothetical protein
VGELEHGFFFLGRQLRFGAVLDHRREVMPACLVGLGELLVLDIAGGADPEAECGPVGPASTVFNDLRVGHVDTVLAHARGIGEECLVRVGRGRRRWRAAVGGGLRLEGRHAGTGCLGAARGRDGDERHQQQQGANGSGHGALLCGVKSEPDVRVSPFYGELVKDL